MPSLLVDGEMQASVAFNKELMKENYPFCELVDKDVNTLIFPNLASGNIAYNLMKELETADAVGPILLGLQKPVHILQLGSSVRSILNMALIAVVDAQIKSKISTDEIVKRSQVVEAVLERRQRRAEKARLAAFVCHSIYCTLILYFTGKLSRLKIFSDIGRFLLMIKGMFSMPENGKMYRKEFMHQCVEIGVGSLGIVVIISDIYRRRFDDSDSLPIG